jgi:hypothetical protein
MSNVDHDTTTHFLLVFIVFLHPSFDSVAYRLMEVREDALALVDLIKVRPRSASTNPDYFAGMAFLAIPSKSVL